MPEPQGPFKVKPARIEHGTTNALVAFEPVQYQVRQETSYFRVEALIPFQVLRAGEGSLVIEWRDQSDDALGGAGRLAEGTKEFYGTGLTRVQNLTLINSDGSCTHFAESENVGGGQAVEPSLSPG